MSSESEHEWFRSQIATYLAQGLSDPRERQRFENHARECKACAEEYGRFQQMEGNMSELFSAAMPDSAFEERILDRLRMNVTSHRRRIHLIVRKAAVAAAAAVVIGGFGYHAKNFIEHGTVPQLAIGLPELNRAREVASAPPSTNNEKWEYSGGGNTASEWDDWNARVKSDHNIPQASQPIAVGAGSFDLNGFNQTINALAGGTPGGPSVKTLTLNPTDNSRATYQEGGRRGVSTANQLNSTRTSALGGEDPGTNGSRMTTVSSGMTFLTGAGTISTGNVGNLVPGIVAGTNLGLSSDQVRQLVKTGGGTLQLRSNHEVDLSGYAVNSGTVGNFGGRRGGQLSAGNLYQNLANLNSGVQLNAESNIPQLATKLGGGEVVLGDGHVDFRPRAFAGIANDNIHNDTRNKDGSEELRENISHPFSSPYDKNDNILLPTEDQPLPALRSATRGGFGGGGGGGTQLPAIVGSQTTKFGNTDQSAGGTTAVGSGKRASGSLALGEVNSSFKPNDFEKNNRTDSSTEADHAKLVGELGRVAQLNNSKDLQDQLARDGQRPNREYAQVTPSNQPAPAVPPTQPTAGGATASAATVRHVIRNGTMEFEVDNYDSTFTTIGRVVAEEGGFIAAADSDKLPNGKVRGSVTVRVPPDNLDRLVMKLRSLGELKNQKLGSTDIGKEYTDLESQLRAARAMEERLLEMIKTAQGKVTELLAAEKELGNWRTKIEQIQGQLNYYNNLTSLATLTVSAYEKDIRTPASATQMEEINAGVETEDVESARAAAIKSIDDVKGRIVESTLQKLEAGQFAAKIVAEVAPENAGPLVDRLKQLGRVARLDIQRKQTEATNPAVRSLGPAKIEQLPTRLIVSMYNLANVAPRLTTNLNLAGEDVEGAYRAILKRVSDAGGRVVSSNLNRQDATQAVGAMQFEVKAADADAVLNDIRNGVHVLRYTVTENPDTANVTTAKQAFVVQILPLSQVSPRLTTNLNLAASDVEVNYRAIIKRVTDAGGRIISSNLNRTDATQAIGSIQFELKSEQADAVRNDITKGVQVLQLTVNENPDMANVTTAKQVFVVQVIPTSQVAPREMRSLAVETSEVEKAMQNLSSAVNGAGGRTLESNLSQDANGRMIARLSIEVPLDKADSLVDAAKQQGKVRTSESAKNAQVPEGPLARARLNLVIGSGDTIVPAEDGFWHSLRGGLSTSIKGLLWSFELIVIGLCLIGPWALLLWGGWRFMRRRKQST